MRSRWKRVLLFCILGIVVLVLALGGGFYLWFHNQVGASNARVDPDIIAALKEKPSTTTTVTAATTTSTLPGSITPATSDSTSDSSTTSSSEQSTTTAPYASPSGMNIVLLGYDKRAAGSSEVTEGRSDVIILVHIDPAKHFMSLLSVPRDLRTVVEGFGHRKINAAYAYGGGALLIRTIQDRLGVDLDHYIAVDLTSFKAITDAIGGVYVDVDRTYSDGKIVLDPGYQLLDGLNAERFCRTRHDLNIDFGRMARQQRFLSATRQQVMKWNLPLKLPSLISTIFKYADTDMSANDVLKLAYWVMKLDGSGIKRSEITGPTGSIGGSFYILPSDQQVAAAVQDFFTPPVQTADKAQASSNTSTGPLTQATLTQADLGGSSLDVVNASGRAGQGAIAALWLRGQGASIVGISTAEAKVSGQGVVKYPGSRGDAAQNVAQALSIQQLEKSSDVDRVTVILGDTYSITTAQLAGISSDAERLASWRALQHQSGIALMAPSYVPSDFSYSFDRSYDLTVGSGSKPAVRVGYRFKGEDLYAGVSATTWTDAPLKSPGVEVQGDGVIYTVVGATNKPDHVWWVKDKVLYWVSNTIFGDLTREQLLAIAISTVSVPAAQ
jgi:polyisoprenyl-teichoic acid--peptidoglycan teichoic acid transferase